LAAVQACDSETPVVGGDVPVVDNDTGTADDTGTSPADAGDAGTNPVDTGTNPVDTGTNPVDTGTNPVDTGTTPDDAGTPVDTGTPVDAPTCLSGQMSCAGSCVDTQTDNSNCGTCGTVCGTGQTCTAGVCACMTGQTLCAGACVDTQSSDAHCGACGTACPSGQTCRAGVCGAACAAPRTVCGTTCADTQTDSANCGSCGTMCPAGQTCQMGACACAGGGRVCGGMCINAQTDNNNCGDCGVVCPSGQTCTAGTCACPGGQAACGTACVSLQTDGTNCGACGNACGAGQTCTAGVCTCPSGQSNCSGTCANLQTSNTNCGTCGTACSTGLTCIAGSCGCPTGQANCGGTCINVQTDNANCGTCGNMCSAGQTCAAGVCACPAGQTACGSTCVNVRTDNANCGACGTACSGGETCMNGVCACAAGQTACSGACVNTRTDNANCGACGTRCVTGQSCANGACACPAGQSLCAGACVNQQNDNSNCGMCGRACSGGSSCNAGVCTFAPPANDLRTAAVDINMTAPASTFTVNTTMAMNNTAGPASCGCTNGRDVFYRFVLTGRELVYADTIGSAFNTSLFFQDSAGANLAAAGLTGGAFCADDGGLGCATGQQSQVLVSLPAGTYFLVVSGCDQGAATVHFQHLPVGTATVQLARTEGVTTTVVGTLTGTSQVAATCGNNGAGPETTGWLVTCPTYAGGAFNATTAGDQRTDTVLDQRSAARSTVSVCNDDTSYFQSALGTTLPAGAGLHTVYVDSFNAALPAGQGGYTLRYTLGACAAGTTLCGNRCINLQTDNANCGVCGTTCTGGSACTAGACACPAGQTYCGGSCIVTTTDVSNCGACGTRCGFGQVCSRSTCVNAVTGPSFQVTSLTATACVSVDAAAIVSDTIGGIAVSATQVFDGGSFTGRFSATNLTGGVRVGTNYDGLLSNLRTNEVYALATASGFLTRNTGSQVITRLVRLDPATGAATATVIPLSVTIPVSTSSNIGGVYSGYDRAVIHTGTNAFHIELPTGVTRDLGNQGIPDLRRGCTGTWANWGVVEAINGILYLDFLRTDNRVARVQVGATAGSVIGTQLFTNLGDACSFTVSPTLNRWYFSSDAITQFRAATTETLVSCNATWSRPSDSFQISSLAATGCGTAEVGINAARATVSGNDVGGVALSNTNVFFGGATTAVRASAGDLGGVATVTPARRLDVLVSELRYARVFALGNGTTPATAGSTALVNSLIEIDGNTGAATGRTIALSQSLALTAGAGIFSGWESIGLWTGGRAYEISLPTGTVRDLGAVTVSGFGCEGGYFYGVLEFFGGNYYFVNRTATASNQRITRTAIPSGAVTTLGTFTNLGDMCSVNFAPGRNRWYFHSETANQFRTPAAAEQQIQTLGYCSGSFARP